MSTPRLYLSPPHLCGRERALVTDAFDSNWIAPLGPHVTAFESEMCRRLGAGYATALSSGTAALHLALVLLGIGPGDHVLCSTLTFAASANPIRYLGATPVFVDADPRTWVTSTVSAVAPANTTQIRVSAAATNMVASCSTACTAGQDVRFDNFSLTQDSPTGFNKLGTRNGNLDTPGAPTNWTLTTVGNDPAQFNHDSFAIHTGQTGFWLRSFQGTQAAPADAKIQQTVAATAGTSYTFSSWAKLQEGYIGLSPSSGVPGGPNTFITMEFLNSGGSVIGSAVSLELGPNGPLGQTFWPADGPTGDPHQGDWRQVSLPATVAPAGTTSIRVSAGATGMYNSGAGFPQSAMFDDLALTVPGSGSGNLLSGQFAAAIPEPGSLALALLALLGGIGCRARRR